MSNILLSCRNLAKSFNQVDAAPLEIFKNVSFEVSDSETVSIVGSSGSGKTSLLQILAGLDSASDGRVIVCGEELTSLNQNQLCALRNKHLGFIYQFHHLLPEFTALENTMMPLLIGGMESKETREYAEYILQRIGLGKRLEHYPNQLSGGERQRVAIARAVVNKPKIVFADEPTGNLDNTTAHQVLDIFFELQQELKTSLIIVTHDREIAAKTQRIYTLHNGALNANF
ncbi:MAG: ATP-binding cassette domain-containing protein [Neisseriaceae bacterium]|nr:MAG: ATP-binding cassette domain-containing protein [Neisseriaceae bacterium]